MRLLLVEDEPRVASFIQKGLEEERYQVDVAPDADRGLDLGSSGIYDLIVLDVMLPDRSGLEVCKELRERDIQIPILMLTAKNAVGDKIAGFGAGADDYLTKPFAFEELIARIYALLRRPEGFRSAPLAVADLILDGESHEVHRAGEPIELTAREFALLEFLMRQPGRVLSRTLIEAHVWGYQEDPLTNVVNVYIRRLRQKIDRAGRPPLIHTVRGVGYRIAG